MVWWLYEFSITPYSGLTLNWSVARASSTVCATVRADRISLGNCCCFCKENLHLKKDSCRKARSQNCLASDWTNQLLYLTYNMLRAACFRCWPVVMEHCLVSNWLLGYKWIAWNLERLILLWLWSHELCKNPTAWQGCWQVSFKLKWPEEKVPQVQTHTAWCRLWRITKCQPCQPLSDSSDWTLHASLGCFSKLTMTDRLTVQRFILHGKDTW